MRCQKGEYVKFFDADDLLESETIAAEVEVLGGKKDVLAACPWWHLEWSGCDWVRADLVNDVTDLPYAEFLPGQKLLWPRNIVEEVGGWDETLVAWQDIDFCSRAAIAGFSIITADYGGFVYRDHASARVTSGHGEQYIELRIRTLENIEHWLRDKNQFENCSLNSPECTIVSHRAACPIVSASEIAPCAVQNDLVVFVQFMGHGSTACCVTRLD